jgi:O-antigen/teichoic acid export membrane protein
MKLIKNSFISSSFFYIILTVVNGVFTILATTLIVNNLSVTIVGEIDLLISVTGFLVTFIHFGSSTFIAQKNFIKQEKKTNIYSNAISLFLFNSIIISIISVVVFCYFGFIEYIFVVSYSILLSFVSLYLSFLQLNNFKLKFALVSTSIVVLNYFILLGFNNSLFFYETRLYSLIFTYLLISSVILFYNKGRISKYLYLVSFKMYKSGYNRGKVLFFGAGLSIMTEKFDRLFVYKVLGSFSAGIYSTLYQFGSIMLVLQSSISRAWIPYLKELNDDKKKEKKAIIFASIFYLIISLIIASLSVLYIDNFLPSDYHEYWFIVYIISFSYALDGILKLFNGIYILNEEYNLSTKLNFLSAITNIIFVIIFYSSLGIYGIALSMLISFSTPLLYIYYKNSTK